MNLLFAPHSDDETLFAAFTVLRFSPLVVICFPSTQDYGKTEQRLAESRRAVNYLGGSGVEQWDGLDLPGKMATLLNQVGLGEHVFAPSLETSHPDHRSVGRAALEVFGSRVRQYHTYKDGVKVRSQHIISFEPSWVQRKLLALAQYTSQIEHPRAHQFFLEDLREYWV